MKKGFWRAHWKIESKNTWSVHEFSVQKYTETADRVCRPPLVAVLYRR